MVLSFLAAKVKSTDYASHSLRHYFKKGCYPDSVVPSDPGDKDLHQNCEMDFRHCGEEVGSGGRRFSGEGAGSIKGEDSVGMPQGLGAEVVLEDPSLE